jgi:hypothetical protein
MLQHVLCLVVLIPEADPKAYAEIRVVDAAFCPGGWREPARAGSAASWDGGRTIHFEGTYTNDFSGNPYKTPRYNYNQVLYRLDLATMK